MKQNLTGIFTARYWIFVMTALLFAALAACGGGNGSAGTPLGGSGSGGTGSTTTSTKYGTITLALTNQAGTTASAIPTSSYLTVSATVNDANGAAVPNALVTFSVSNAAGLISPALGTALTNAKGVAQVTLQSGTSSGAGNVTASTTAVGTTVITALPVAFSNSAATTTTASTPTLTLNLANSTNCPVGSLSSSCSLIANATLKDGNGNALPANLVTFSSTQTLAALNPSTGTALTNSSGVASLTVVPVSLQAALTQTGAAGQVNATATVNGVTLVAAQYFTMGSTSLTLALSAPATGATNISAYGTTTIAVSINSNNALYTAQPVTVNFTSGCLTSGAASYPTTATTVNGVASITYRDNGCGELDTVTANVTGASAPVTASINVAKPVATSIKFVSATPNNESIVLPGSGGNGRTSTAVLTYQVIDTSGNPVPNVQVDFTNAQSSVAQLTTAAQITDASGNVVATVNALTVGTFRITASLDSNALISTISDSVVVSQGFPVNGSFTIAPFSLNIPAWNTVMTDAVTVYLADANGNPVAAGTPISATTDAGTIQNANGNSGGCTTDSFGKCALLYTTSLPRPASGVGVITVTTTDGSANTLSASTGIVWSSNGVNAYVPAPVAGQWTLATPTGTNIPTTYCSPNVQIILTDTNGNPLAFGTKIAAASTQSGVTVGTTIPATVQNIGADDKSGNAPIPTDVYEVFGGFYIQGVSVTVPLTLVSPAATCKLVSAGGVAAAGSVTFTVTVTPPNGSAIPFTFTLQYPA